MEIANLLLFLWSLQQKVINNAKFMQLHSPVSEILFVVVEAICSVFSDMCSIRLKDAMLCDISKLHLVKRPGVNFSLCSNLRCYRFLHTLNKAACLI